MGLLQSVGHFDPSKGARFSTYAVFRIKAAILRSIADKDRLVRVPVHAQDTAMRIIAASHTLEAETGSPPTDAQLALALTMPEQTVARYRNSIQPQKFTNIEVVGVGPKNEASEASRLEGWMRDAARLADAHVFREDVLRLMGDCLSPAEERALRLRFGISGDGETDTARTFKEIGRVMEVSAEGIRQMVFRAIRKLQDSDEARLLLMGYTDRG